MLNSCLFTLGICFWQEGGPAYTVAGKMNGEVRAGMIDI